MEQIAQPSGKQPVKQQPKQSMVCKLCGKKLTKKTMTFGSFRDVVWYCDQCGQIESGVPEEMFLLAEEYVEKSAFQYFLNIDEDVRSERRNNGKVCEILQQFHADVESRIRRDEEVAE